MISFVILHYKSIRETLECLECLTNTFNSQEISLIVVDNHSLTNDQEKMIRKYTDDIILLDDNIGFAKANNKGCKYAKKKYRPDFIAVINNDVFITQKDFITLIKKDYDKYQFDMLGPAISSPSQESCNPFPVILGKNNIEKRIKKTKKLIKIYQSPILYYLLKAYIFIKHLVNKPVIPENGKELTTNAPLHGCAIIFSKQYYQKYSDVFFNGTYLFHEEEFLYKRVLKDKLISLYDPELKVFHKEGSSRNKKNLRLSKLFREQEKFKSLELLLQDYDN